MPVKTSLLGALRYRYVLGVEPPVKSSESNETGPDDVLMGIEQLSDDEVERMFASKVRGA